MVSSRYNKALTQTAPQETGGIMDITVERHTWGLLLSTIHGGYLVTHKYIGYSVRAAKADFRQIVRG
jgi:hypothetical protein